MQEETESNISKTKMQTSSLLLWPLLATTAAAAP